MSLKNVIKHKNKRPKRFIWKDTEVVVKDEITNPEVSIQPVLQIIGKKIPEHFLTNVDIIYVGEFEFFKEREIQAMYENSCIFVTNQQDSIDDMCDDIVHEIAHSLEELYGDMIYSDDKIEREFITKRKQLLSILRAEGFEVSEMLFMNPEYTEQFDEYLYKHVGYDVLNMLSAGIFYSPYAATSLREYFANGFEGLYYYGEYQFISKHCPQLFTKLNNLMEMKK